MKPGTVPPVAVYAGDTCAWPAYQIKLNGEPRDLSSWVEWAAVWRRTAWSDDAVELSLHLGELASGRFSMTATAAQTRAMAGDGVFDVQATSPSGEVRTWIVGTTTWRQDVTRDE